MTFLFIKWNKKIFQKYCGVRSAPILFLACVKMSISFRAIVINNNRPLFSFYVQTSVYRKKKERPYFKNIAFFWKSTRKREAFVDSEFSYFPIFSLFKYQFNLSFFSPEIIQSSWQFCEKRRNFSLWSFLRRFFLLRWFPLSRCFNNERSGIFCEAFCKILTRVADVIGCF